MKVICIQMYGTQHYLPPVIRAQADTLQQVGAPAQHTFSLMRDGAVVGKITAPIMAWWYECEGSTA